MNRMIRIFLCLAVLMLLTVGTVFAGHLEDIAARGTIRIGTTGDYIPMSYRNPQTGAYEGIDAELSQLIADSLGVKIEYVPTSWPTLTADTLAGKFDIALCGISRNYARAKTMAMSDAYGEGAFGKTILCRKSDAKKYQSLADIDKPEVRVMINPGGTNEKFAHANLKKAKLIVHQENADIPQQVAEGNADIMITETVEAARYIELNDKLAAPLMKAPFTRHSCGILMQKGDQEFLNYINFVLAELKMDGTLAKLEKKYLYR
ncbi:transporter substrate-binding domain-containing protein [Selenomonas ruminantium]|uniref:Cyclohexadienyl dehydratase n=1 Tax=Selenomonas ruminantium TaxID=971 RepID=A0A1I0VPT5_SELRU|nr:transporter substrate-binding domain-containing protein [Selenomonas ruminantium]SFA77983.1 cyclohexadienyl dehydratase [Selenomonas ruminantium]